MTKLSKSAIIAFVEHRGVAQLVAHTSGGRDAAGSSPVTPTIPSVHKVSDFVNTRFFCFYAVFMSVRYITDTPCLVSTFTFSNLHFAGISSVPMNL